MNHTSKRMKLLSEVRTPAQELNFALARDRSQQNQKEIHRGNYSSSNVTVAHFSSPKSKSALLLAPNTKEYPQC